MRPIITLTTDFGLREPYVAEMKAVILSICPEANIVDISHKIEKFNIRQAAFVLACAAPYFPNGTIHVAIVDPGVGTKRKPILIQTTHAIFIGPDNGVLALAIRNQRITQIREITNKEFMLSQISNTFHGRDVFAPTAAHAANKASLRKIGKKIQEILTPDFAIIVKERGRVTGEIIHVDDFGNIITNVDADCLRLAKGHSVFVFRVKGKELRLEVRKNYAHIQRHRIAGIIGGHGFLEISMNQTSAAKQLGVGTGDAIALFSITEKKHTARS